MTSQMSVGSKLPLVWQLSRNQLRLLVVELLEDGLHSPNNGSSCLNTLSKLRSITLAPKELLLRTRNIISGRMMSSVLSAKE